MNYLLMALYTVGLALIFSAPVWPVPLSTAVAGFVLASAPAAILIRTGKDAE